MHAGHDAPERMVDDVVERDALRATHHDAHLHDDPADRCRRRAHRARLDAVLLAAGPPVRRRRAAELRRVVGAARHHDLLARACACAGGPPAGIRPPLARRPSNRMRCASAEVSTCRLPRLQRGTQIGERARGAAAAPRRGLEEAGAFLGGAVEIGIGGDAGFRRRLDKGLRQRIGMAPVGHRQRPADAVIFVGPRCWFSARLK